VAEFQSQSTKPKDYMAWYLPEVSTMTPGRRDAALAEKFVELTILLRPEQDMLGFPVDELQLSRRTGVHRLHKKPSCPQQ